MVKRPDKRSEYTPSDDVVARAGFLVEAILQQFGLTEEIANRQGVTVKPVDSLEKFLDSYLEYKEIAAAIDEEEVREEDDKNERNRLARLKERLKDHFAEEQDSPEYQLFKKKRILPKLHKIFVTLASGEPITNKDVVKRTLDLGVRDLARIQRGIDEEIINFMADASPLQNMSPVQKTALNEDLSNLRHEFSLVTEVKKKISSLSKAMVPARGLG